MRFSVKGRASHSNIHMYMSWESNVHDRSYAFFQQMQLQARKVSNCHSIVKQ